MFKNVVLFNLVMPPARCALIGFHDPENLSLYRELIGYEGFKIDAASCQDDMLRMAREARHGIYIMDVNLGVRGSQDPKSSEAVYEIVRKRVEREEAAFVALSGSDDAVNNARKLGIPAEVKGEFDVFEWIDSLYR